MTVENSAPKEMMGKEKHGVYVSAAPQVGERKQRG